MNQLFIGMMVSSFATEIKTAYMSISFSEKAKHRLMHIVIG